MDDRRRDRLLRLVAGRAEDLRQGSAWVDVVCAVAVEQIDVDGVAMSLRMVDEEQELIASSEGWAESLEELQYAVGDGPGVDAFAAGSPVLVADLTFDEQRWPGFADAASANGARAAFAFPPRLNAIRLRTLDLYRHRPGPLRPDEVLDALTLADLAMTALLADAAGEGDQVAAWAREDIAGHYDDVHVATGLLAAQLKISLQDALLRLRAHAFSQRLPVTAVARAVLDRQLRFDESQE